LCALTIRTRQSAPRRGCWLILPALRPLFQLPSFFFTATAPTDLYTLSLHDALPICSGAASGTPDANGARMEDSGSSVLADGRSRSEEHTSELQSRGHLVCRLLLEKKNAITHGRSRPSATVLTVALE